jgi:hypothetical protein
MTPLIPFRRLMKQQHEGIEEALVQNLKH